MTREELMQQLPERLMRLGVPTLVRKRLMEPLDETPALQAVRAMMFPTLVLAGGNGCGKTMAACSLIADQCEDRSVRFHEKDRVLGPYWGWRGALFVRARDIANLSAYDRDDQAKLASLLSTSLLILDELGDEDGDGERGIGRMLCDRIDEGSLRTVVTTNLSPETISQRYGARLQSRLVGCVKIVHSKDLRSDG